MKHPNGMWIWQLSKLRRDYLDALNQVKCSRIYLKVLDDFRDDIFWAWQCSPEIVGNFKEKGIEVWGWGYIFDQRSSTDTSGVIDALRRAVGCGMEGFVFDVEQEVKNPATHEQLKEILSRAKAIIPPGCMGYTSFGAPEFHQEVPYKMLHELCDLQFPQIYFEKFTFGEGPPGPVENEAEVTTCLKQHQTMGLDKPILPIWGSESDSLYPASSDELQKYLVRYPGSSIWRAPNAGERGEAWKCTYQYAADLPDNVLQLQPQMRSYRPAPIPMPFTQNLKLGDQGDEVYVLVCALMGLGFLRKEEQVSDVFDGKIDDAVRWAQKHYQIDVDGIVGPITKSSLENALRSTQGEKVFKLAPESGGFNGLKFADFCEEQLCGNILWSPDIKFIQPFVRKLGRQRWPWCGATVYWLINEFLYKPNGKNMPLQYPEMEATFAVVEAFEEFFQKRGWYQDNRAGYVPPPGAVIMFDWNQRSIDEPDLDGEDHIGVFLRMTGDLFVCAEGNTDTGTVRVGRTGIKEHKRQVVQGFGIIPEGWAPTK